MWDTHGDVWFERSSVRAVVVVCFGFVRTIFWGGEWSEIYRYSYDSSEMITYLFFTLGIYLLVPLYHDPCVHLKIVWMILKCHGLGQRVTADRLESASNVVGVGLETGTCTRRLIKYQISSYRYY